MGDWNETCAISKLAIRGGERVRLLPIAMNPYHIKVISGLPDGVTPRHCYSGQSGCYIGDLYFPLCYPIRGQYNTYGSISHIPDKTRRDKAEILQFTEAFRKHCIPLPLGENEYHDAPLKEFTIPEILGALQEGRCFIKYKNHNGKIDRLLPVAWMMVKESVWQSLLKLDLNISDYFWEKQPSYKEGRLITKKKIDLAILTQYIRNNRSSIDKSKLADLLIKRSDLNEELKYSDLIFLYRSPFEAPEISKDLLAIISECEYIHSALSILRINYAPTTGSGSQATNAKIWKSVYESWNKLR